MPISPLISDGSNIWTPTNAQLEFPVFIVTTSITSATLSSVGPTDAETSPGNPVSFEWAALDNINFSAKVLHCLLVFFFGHSANTVVIPRLQIGPNGGSPPSGYTSIVYEPNIDYFTTSGTLRRYYNFDINLDTNTDNIFDIRWEDRSGGIDTFIMQLFLLSAWA